MATQDGENIYLAGKLREGLGHGWDGNSLGQGHMKTSR